TSGSPPTTGSGQVRVCVWVAAPAVGAKARQKTAVNVARAKALLIPMPLSPRPPASLPDSPQSAPIGQRSARSHFGARRARKSWPGPSGPRGVEEAMPNPQHAILTDLQKYQWYTHMSRVDGADLGVIKEALKKA